MGCFVRGGKNGMGCFVRGDKNCMGCFVRGGKFMRDVLSGVAKNGMGCFVPGCFVLHSGANCAYKRGLRKRISMRTDSSLVSVILKSSFELFRLLGQNFYSGLLYIGVQEVRNLVVFSVSRACY